MKHLSFLLLTILLLTPMFPSVTLAQSNFNPDFLLSDAEFFDTLGMTQQELSLFLLRGSLGSLRTKDWRGIERSASEIIWKAAQDYQLNPQFLLVLLQREQSLVEDDSPSKDQLGWAMGYAVCDDCSKSDPRIQKFKGFGNQVHFAAKRIRENYLPDLEGRGFTESGIGPGIEIIIDGTRVTPVNFVTSALYTYTPHLHGNENFVKIWNRWFTRSYLSGSLLQDKKTGGIWLIKDYVRRPITSRAAFYSRFNESFLIQVNASQLETYPIGAPIAFPNYSLLRSPRGTVYLLVDDTRRGFASREAFRAIGFSPDEIVDVEWSDLDAYVEGEPITTEAVYPQGALLQDKTTGGVFFTQNGRKHPIMSREILEANAVASTIVAVSPQDLEAYTRAEPLTFPDGTLVAADGSPDVFVIADGERHLIEDELTFLSYGWRWNQIVWTNERSVLLHPLGDNVSNTLEDVEELEIANN